jgi:hypothetical protein
VLQRRKGKMSTEIGSVEGIHVSTYCGPAHHDGVEVRDRLRVQITFSHFVVQLGREGAERLAGLLQVAVGQTVLDTLGTEEQLRAIELRPPPIDLPLDILVLETALGHFGPNRAEVFGKLMKVLAGEDLLR